MPVIQPHKAYSPVRPEPARHPAGQTGAAPDSRASPGRDGFNFSTADEIRQILGDLNVRRISPKNMNNLSKMLFEAGHISFREYAMLSFQPKMEGPPQADDRDSNRPRDYIDQWEQQLARQQERGERPDFIRQSRRLLNILHNLHALVGGSSRDYMA